MDSDFKAKNEKQWKWVYISGKISSEIEKSFTLLYGKFTEGKIAAKKKKGRLWFTQFFVNLLF